MRDDPAVIISASGHVRGGDACSITCAARSATRRTPCLIVGFQAQHTLGRRLVERRENVRIFGVERERRAEVVVLNGFSAHDRHGADLRRYAKACSEKGAWPSIALVHGELKAHDSFARGVARRTARAKVIGSGAGRSAAGSDR